ncbi:MAG: hypothetical protein H7333_11985 [Bdellovibrionales bacterium]|nr:hypothetical protein [Oligoflexia bacterium]
MILHFLLALIPLQTPAAKATSFYIRPFSEFTETTPVIVRGKLNNIHAENSITADGARTIYTYANLEVKEVFKGDLHQKSAITVRKIGGTKNGMTLEVPSSPQFKENEETVLFLSAEKEDQAYEVLGLELGKFGLDEKNGEVILTGGIFNYSKPDPEHGHDHSERAKNLVENQQDWNLGKLRALIQSQKASPPNLKISSSPDLQKSVNKPSTSGTPLPSSSSVASVASPAQLSSGKEGEDSTPFRLPFYLGGALLMFAAFSFLRKR